MKSILLLVTLGLATILAEDTPLLKTLSDTYHNFTSKIYYEAVLRRLTNYAVCPTTLNIFLSIIYAGVQGNSTKAITDLLQIPKGIVVNHQTFSDLARMLSRDDYLNFANVGKIYLQDGFQISNTYRRTFSDIFKGDIEIIDFKQPEKALKTVNSWVYENSNHLIGEIIAKNNLKKTSTMYLISTVNFRGLFTKNLFKAESTIQRDFYINMRESVKIDMMEAFSNCSYYESKELDAKFLKLNFTNIDNGSITFILPNNKESLRDLESKINQVFIKPNYSTEYVHIIIPTFKIEPVTFDDIEFRIAGIRDAFEDEANFTVIGANQEPLKIVDIGQKVIVEVDENGAGATWATYSMLKSITPEKDPYNGVGLSGNAVLSFDFDLDYVEPRTFKADHPFIYYITINDANIVVGKITKPEVRVVNQLRRAPVRSLNKIEQETKFGNRIQPTEAPMKNIVEEYTCPCKLD